MMPLQVANWSENFENSKSRQRDRCGFVCLPNKQSGLGLTYILSLSDGPAVYGIWCLMLGALSKQRKPREGWLTHDGTEAGDPWQADELALKWRTTPKLVNRALEVLTSERVKWIVTAECPPSDRAVTAECPTSALERKKEEKGKKEMRTDTAGAFDALWQHYPRKIGKARSLDLCRRLVKQGKATWDELTRAVKNYAADCERKQTEDRFILHGSTFFGPTARWSDYVDAIPTPATFKPTTEDADAIAAKRRREQTDKVTRENWEAVNLADDAGKLPKDDIRKRREDINRRRAAEGLEPLAESLPF